MCARLEIRTGRLAHTRMCVASRRARSASEMQSCWLDNATFIYIIFFDAFIDRAGFGFGHGHIRLAPRVWAA